VCAADSAVEVAAAAPLKVKSPGGVDPKAPAFKETVSGKSDVSSWGQISGTAVNVRCGPGLDHAVITTLKGGEYLKVGAASGSWIEVEWPQAVPVWVSKENVHSAHATDTATVKISTAVRAGGSRKAAAFGQLEAGTKLSVLSEGEGWLKVKAPETLKAYINSKYLILNVRKPIVTGKKSADGKSVEAIINENGPAPAKAATPESASTSPESARTHSESNTKKLADLEKLARNVAEVRHREEESARIEKLADQEALALHVAEVRHEQELESARRATEAAKLAKEEQERIAAEEAKRLAERQEQFWKAAEARRQEELARAAEAKRSSELAEAKRKAEAEAEARRLAEAQKKAELEAEARRAEEARQRAEAEAEARRVAEAQRKAELEAEAKRVAEARQKTEAEAEARRIAEAKRLAELEAERKKAAAPVIEDETEFFVAPLKVASAPIAPAPKIEEAGVVVSLSTLPEPSAAVASRPVQPPKAAPVFVDPGVETTKADRSKFVLPNRAPKKPGARAEVVECIEDSAPVSKDVKTASQAETERFVQPPATFVFPVSSPPVEKEKPADVLPTPSGEAPVSLRLPSYHEIRVDPADTGAQLTTAEGTVERHTAHPFENAGYALVRSGVTLYYLTARPGVNLDVMVGQKVRLSGAATQHSGTTVLDVATITSQE
jgi:uncharacterized protein YgiM (DUF1202 family)